MKKFIVAEVADWPLYCHNDHCNWRGKVKDVYSAEGQGLRCPGCQKWPNENTFMIDYRDSLLRGKAA